MTKNRKHSGEFTDFEELKMQLSSARIDVRIRQDAIKKDPDLTRYPAIREDFERKIKALQERISQLEAIVATEPPPPELPPRQPLFKVSGMLEEFSVQKVKGYFADSEYDPEAFARQEASNQVGSVLLAMTGNAAGSAVTGQSKIKIKDACDFVRGKINGVPFSGWLGKTHVQSGDYVDMAVMKKDDHYVVYAIALPELRTITMTPQCACGREGDIYFETHYSAAVMGGIYSVILLILKFKGAGWTDVLICSAIFAAILLAACVYAVYSINKKPDPKTLLAENIFVALDFTNPKCIDLRRSTKKHSKEQPPVTDREIPSDSLTWVDYFYYY